MNATVITSYREADEVLRVNTLRQSLYEEGAILMKDVLVNLFGEEHQARRHLAQKLFRRDYFRNYERLVFPRTIAETLVPYLEAGGGDLADFSYRVLMNLTADSSGIDRPTRTREETATLLRMIHTFSQAATLGQITSGDPDRIRGEIARTLVEFDAAFFEPSERRRRALIDAAARGEIDTAALPRDLLTILMLNEDKVDLPRDKLIKETAYFLFVGALSSTHALTHAMHHVFTWRAEHPEDAGRIEQDPAFLQRCIWESLRLHPPTPELHRRLTCPVHVKSRAQPIDTQDLTIDMKQVNQDPAMFGADPQTFDPRRPDPPQGWLYGITFGLGVHACLGRILVAGTPIQPDADPQEIEYGTLHLIIKALLDHGIRPDPDRPPTVETLTTRKNWKAYPFVLSKD
jgi:cytochrome P450